MENSYPKDANSRLPFGEFQARFDGNIGRSRSSAATHLVNLSTPPPQIGQFADPRMFPGPGFKSVQTYASDQLSANAFGQVPFESPPFQTEPRTRPLTSTSQFTYPSYSPPRSGFVGEFQPRPWNMPSPPVNVNVPPPPLINVNMPLPLPPIDASIPPPGFHLRVPPPVFNRNCPPPAIPSSTSTSMLPHSQLMSNVPQTSSFVNRTPVAGTREQSLGIQRQPMPSFISSQRIPSNSVIDVDVLYRPNWPSFHGALSNDDGISKSPSVSGYVPTVSVSSATSANKCADTDSKSLLLSTVTKNSCSSLGGLAVATTMPQTLPESRRRRASRKSTVTVSCNMF